MPGPAASLGPNDYTEDDARNYVALTYVGNYVLYATACVLVYELLTSLDDEVARVWSLKWRMPKILFMLNRYVIRAMLLCLWILADYPGTSPEFCRIYSYWQMIPLRLAILAAQALVVIRVWAIYNNSRRMFWVLGTLYTVEVAAVTTCVFIATMYTQGVAQPAPLSCALPALSLSNAQVQKQFSSATWIAPVCFEFVMVVITLAKLVPRWKWGKNWGLLGSGGNATLDVLARDSLIYFGLIFSFTLTNAIIYELSFSAHYHSLLLGPTSAVSCIAVSRMMINIRSLPSSPLAQPTSSEGVNLSFADSYMHGGTYADGGIPDTARTAFFDTQHSPADHGYFKQHAQHSPRADNGGYAEDGGGYFELHARPGSARTSGDATRVGEVGDDAEAGSVIEMGFMKGVGVV
ncbi:hypothetical protein C8R44DRAFT_885075 [Mycena epipterygia]|nr:hypothetical protein C8R44DRAFT_885075 [Mycena epipterygia]